MPEGARHQIGGRWSAGRKGREVKTQSPDAPEHDLQAGVDVSSGPQPFTALDHRDAIRNQDPLIRLGGLTLEFVAKVVPAPMAMFLIADEGQRCSLAQMRVDPILAADPATIEAECASAIAETVPGLGLPDRFRHHLVLDREGLEHLGGFTGSRFSTEFMPEWGLESILLLIMRQARTGPTCVVALLRTLGEGEFKDREKGFVRQMAPLLSQSWRCATVPPSRHLTGGPALTGAGAGVLDSLTRRELEIARLAAGGAANEEIASSLSITIGTVKCHVRSIYSKLGVHSRVHLSLLLADV